MRGFSFGLFLALVLLVLSPQARGAPKPEWYSGFETGFPGEWLNYDNGTYTASGVPNPGMQEAWTIVSKTQEPQGVFAGTHGYKGWILGANPAGTNHRAYPAIHCDIPSPLVNSFMVYLDVDYTKLAASDWIHFATWGNNPDWEVHTMSVRDRKLEMAHLSWSYIGPTPQPDFPLKKWVRFTVYIHYPPGGQGLVHVWQDGTPVLTGNYTARSGQNLQRAHWGMYTNPEVTQGLQYNDEIQIWSLSAPLTDLTTEPPSPYATSPDAGVPGDSATPTDGPAVSDAPQLFDSAAPVDGTQLPVDGSGDTGGPGPATDASPAGLVPGLEGGCGCSLGARPGRAGGLSLLLLALALALQLLPRRG